MVILASSRILSFHKDTNKPKFIQVVYSNGQVDLIHCLKNGHNIQTIIKKPREMTFYERIRKIFN
jgi:hypothetical protein